MSKLVEDTARSCQDFTTSRTIRWSRKKPTVLLSESGSKHINPERIKGDLLPSLAAVVLRCEGGQVQEVALLAHCWSELRVPVIVVFGRDSTPDEVEEISESLSVNSRDKYNANLYRFVRVVYAGFDAVEEAQEDETVFALMSLFADAHQLSQ